MKYSSHKEIHTSLSAGAHRGGGAPQVGGPSVPGKGAVAHEQPRLPGRPHRQMAGEDCGVHPMVYIQEFSSQIPAGPPSLATLLHEFDADLAASRSCPSAESSSQTSSSFALL